jgi:hypothetical protein
MGFFYHKSASFGPFRVNLSQSSVGYLVGGRGFLDDANDRKAISDARIFLKTYVMPLDEDPFHEFEDGWGIQFTVRDQMSRRQVRALEDDEVAENRDKSSPFTYQDSVDPAEIFGYTIHEVKSK